MGKIKEIAITLDENGYQGDFSDLTVGEALELNKQYEEKYGTSE